MKLEIFPLNLIPFVCCTIAMALTELLGKTKEGIVKIQGFLFWIFLAVTIVNAYLFISSVIDQLASCLLYTSPSPRDLSTSRMPSSA